MHPSSNVSIFQSIYLPMYLSSIYLSSNVSVFQSIYLPIYRSSYTSIFHTCICHIYIFLCIYLPIHVSISSYACIFQHMYFP